MAKLTEIPADSMARITDVRGSVRLLTRFASVGITPGAIVRVVRNDPKRPVLVYERDTLLALNRAECDNIEAEEVA